MSTSVSSVKIELEGIEDLQKQLEELRSTRTVLALNRKIIQAGQEAGRAFIQRNMPRSRNLKNSGPKRGFFRTSPDKHAADNVPVDKIRRYSDMTQYAFIGWRPSDNSLNFYAKFSEEGVDEHTAKRNNGRPVPYIRAIHLFERAKLPAETEITRIGVALYEKKLKEVLGE